MPKEIRTCDTCKWWGVDFEGVCYFPDTITGSKVPPEKKMEVYASALDDTDLTAHLTTGPKFGCIHHCKLGE